MFDNQGEYLLTRTVAPASAPVTSAESKADLKIEHSDEDALISSLILAATEYAEQVSGKALITQTWAYSVRSVSGNQALYLPVTPVQSISSISYFDTNNDSQTLTVSDFYFHGTEDWAYIQPKQGQNWPGLYDRLDAITVTFVAGFGLAAAVPVNIKQAIRLITAHWYRNRAAASDKPVMEIPMGAESLLGLSRKGWVA